MARIIFKAIICILSCLCFRSVTKAATYFFSSSAGDDNRSSLEAQKSQTPWKSVEKLNAFFPMLQPGDSVLFKKDEVFYGCIVTKSSGTAAQPIVISSYGTGARPIISGLLTLTNWKSLGNGIWECDPCPEAGSVVNILTLNGINVPMGRYPNVDEPNKGFLNYESHVGNTSITDNELQSSPIWTGAELIIRKDRWAFDRSVIKSHSNSTITYAAQTDYEPIDNFGYFFQNDIKTLDKIGEWYYNPEQKKVYIFYGPNKPPTNIQISTKDNILQINNENNISFVNLDFEGSAFNAIELGNASNINIESCDILYAGVDGIYGFSLTNFTIKNSKVAYANNNGIYLAYNCNFSTITNNIVEHIGLNEGMCNAVHYNTFSGISVGGSGENSCHNTIIEKNVLDSIGYNGISFNGNHVLVKNNVVSNFCMTKDDGGGIYTHRGTADNYTYFDRTVVGNIVINGQSAMNGVPKDSYLSTWGIYIDDNAQGISISDNTVANMPSSGVFLHNAHEVQISNNVFYNNREQIRFSNDGIASVQNVTLKHNVAVARTEKQLVIYYSSVLNDIGNIGNLDSNYYGRPMDTISGYIRVNNLYQKLYNWRTFTKQESHSSFPPLVTSTSNDIRFEYNPTARAKTITLDGIYFSFDNKFQSNNIVLQPYSSIVLVKALDQVLAVNNFIFTGSINANLVSLNWKMADTASVASFQVEKSSDGTVFSPIHQVIPKKSQTDFRFTDNEPIIGKNYYRIKWTDLFGKTSFSKILVFYYSTVMSVHIWPNPGHDIIHLAIGGKELGRKINIEIRSAAGLLVRRLPIDTESSNLEANVASLPSGIYYITFTGDQASTSVKFIKQ